MLPQTKVFISAPNKSFHWCNKYDQGTEYGPDWVFFKSLKTLQGSLSLIFLPSFLMSYLNETPKPFFQNAPVPAPMNTHHFPQAPCGRWGTPSDLTA